MVGVIVPIGGFPLEASTKLLGLGGIGNHGEHTLYPEINTSQRHGLKLVWGRLAMHEIPEMCWQMRQGSSRLQIV